MNRTLSMAIRSLVAALVFLGVAPAAYGQGQNGQGGSAQGANGQGGNGGGGGLISAPELDPAVAGAFAAIVAGGAVFLARRRRR